MNWTARLATIFVRNQRLSLLLTIALFLWGGLSFYLTPRQYNPRIVAPSFQIFVEFPGATRTEVLEQVSRPMENVLADIPGVEDIYTVTEAGGRVAATVNFFVGEDLESAKITLQDRVRSNLDLSPLGIEDPLIKSVDPDDVPVLTLALSADSSAAGAANSAPSSDWNPVELRKLAFRLRDRLVTVPGASNVEVVGGRQRELAILIDPVRLATSGVGLDAITRALGQANVYLPSGAIKATERYIPLEADSTVRRASDLENIVVVTGDFGQIRLKDVALVKEQITEIESHVRYVRPGVNGDPQELDPVVLISLAKYRDANISDVTRSVAERLNELRANFLPPGISAEIIVDEGRTAREEISGLVTNLFTAVAIVVIILLLFLDRRAALLVAISIPLTLACVFGLAYLLGENINRITLFALILSLGLLVDNATVVIENIVRRLEGVSEAEKVATIITAVGEVGPGLFMSTVTTVLAFLPMAFVTGMMGPYMGPIPFFVPAALIFSLLLSFTINPYMASVVLRAGPGQSSSSGAWRFVPTFVRRSLDFVSNSGERIFIFYQEFLHSVLVNGRRRRLVLLSVAGLLLASMILPGVGLVKFRMLPKADREQFFLYVDLPEGTPLAHTLKATRSLERFLLKEPGVRMIQSYVGQAPILDFNGLFRGVQERRRNTQATLRVGLSHTDERSITSEELVMELRPRLLEFARNLERPPGASAANAGAPSVYGQALRLKLVEDPPGPPVLSTLLLRVQGPDTHLLEATARDLERRIQSIAEVVDTDVSTPIDTTTLVVRIDQARASLSRVSPAQIVDTLNASYAGRILGIYHNDENIEQEYIRLRLDPRFRVSPETLDRIVLYNELGIRVPLSELTTIVEEPTVKALRRENRAGTVYVYGDMADRSITYAAIDLLFLLADYQLPGIQSERTGFSLFGADFRTADGGDVSISIGGEWELTLEVFRDLGLAMGVAVFLVYFVLVAQFNSFSEPLIIMSTIPLSLIGVLPGFMVLGFLTGEYFTATSMIGVIALAGIAVNNSIILLEYINGMKSGGDSIESALVEAGTTRFRPILLTTVTTILGSMTIVGDPVWAGLAFAIILGLGVSSLLTLIVFPALFFILRSRQWRSAN